MLQLKDYFKGVSAKTLRAVEADRARSNQCQFNGTDDMKAYLGAGTEKTYFDATFIYLGADDADRLTFNRSVTWNDQRINNPDRAPEYRLYYGVDNDVMLRATEGDVLITVLREDSSLLLLVISEENPSLGELLWLFGIEHRPNETFETVDLHKERPLPVSLFHFIAEQAGLDLDGAVGTDFLDLILARFGPAFPTTRQMSALALETLQGDISPAEEPDNTLIKLMDREELLFRQLETYIVSNEITSKATSWAQDVDSFVRFSLAVHNRRKSRAGHALENHLEWIFLENNVAFNRGIKTEHQSKPDFLFPGQRQYRDPNYAAKKLTMLGVKTTCKDRWRQVLNEAHRIPDKHLLTLQPGISEHQTREMSGSRLTLVLPRQLHDTYTPAQREQMLALNEFIEQVRTKQH